MIELLGGGVLGGLIGGLLRLAPEFIKWWDRKDERKHELDMFRQRCELEKHRGDQRMAEIGAQREADVDTGVLSAFQAAIDSQAQMATAAGGWAAKISAAVRPILTYWAWTLYSVAFLMLLWITWQVTRDPVQIVRLVLTADFMALLAGITNYWFLDRTLSKRGLA
jgi:hypothetical protein